MIQDIFLTYANYSLKENPKKLYEIFEKFNALDIYIDRQYEIPNIIRHFIALLKSDDLRAAYEICRKAKLEEEPSSVKGFNPPCEPFTFWNTRDCKIAYEGIYGYRDGYCEDKCSWASEKKLYLEKIGLLDQKG